MGGWRVSGVMPLVAPVLAQVSDVELAKQLFKAANVYYYRGEYEAALEEFKKTYKLSGEPELHYNIALCYEKLVRFEDAIATYRLYLKEVPGAPDRKKVESRIDFLTKQIEAHPSVGAASVPRLSPPAPPPNIVVTPSPEPEEVEEEDGVDTYIPPPEEEDAAVIDDVEPHPGGAPYRILMWTSFGLSAVGLAAGAIGTYQSGKKEGEYNGMVDDLYAEGNVTGSSSSDGNRFVDDEAKERYSGKLNDLKSDMKIFNRIALAGFIGGTATLALGGLFYWLDLEQAAQRNGAGQAAVTLEPGTSGGSVSLRWRF